MLARRRSRQSESRCAPAACRWSTILPIARQLFERDRPRAARQRRRPCMAAPFVPIAGPLQAIASPIRSVREVGPSWRHVEELRTIVLDRGNDQSAIQEIVLLLARSFGYQQASVTGGAVHEAHFVRI